MSHFQRPFLIAASLILLVSAFALAEDQETKIHQKDLPAAVLQAFQREYPRAKIIGAAREIEKEVEYYEIECKDHGVKRDVLYKPNGDLVVVEEMIRVTDLPTVVRDGVMKAYPKGKIKSAEKITRAGATSFQVMVKDGKKLLEIAVGADGTITETEEKTGKDKD